jgi:hypothetical protein
LFWRSFRDAGVKYKVLLPSWIWGSHSDGYEEFYLLVLTLCSPLEVNRCFWGTCRLHLWAQGISQAKLHTSFLLSLLLDSEDGGDMFLRNIGWLSRDYIVLYPRRQNFLLISCLISDRCDGNTCRFKYICFMSCLLFCCAFNLPWNKNENSLLSWFVSSWTEPVLLCFRTTPLLYALFKWIPSHGVL